MGPENNNSPGRERVRSLVARYSQDSMDRPFQEPASMQRERSQSRGRQHSVSIRNVSRQHSIQERTSAEYEQPASSAQHSTINVVPQEEPVQQTSTQQEPAKQEPTRQEPAKQEPAAPEPTSYAPPQNEKVKEAPAQHEQANNGQQSSKREDAVQPHAEAEQLSEKHAPSSAPAETTSTVDPMDPYGLAALKNTAVTRPEIKSAYPNGPHRKIESFYNRQNEFIDELLQSNDEERLEELDHQANGGKVRFAVNASFAVNFCLFAIQMFAAVTTGSLSLFATAADAFMDLVSSIVMLITSRLANKPNPVKYPVGRRRIETVGIILFCALMTTVAVQLIVESARALGEGARTSESLKLIPLICVSIAIGAKFSLFLYCFALRRYPAARVFFIDHRNDLVVNVFGLVMSIVGTRFVWYLDPVGAMCIGFLILYSWASTAFEQVWLLVGKSAPKEFINKVIYVTVTHDPRIRKIDTCRAYHAGEHLYVEVDIVMDPDIRLQDSHDVGQTLQRKLEGLADVERAFVHVDYEHDHNVWEEHRPVCRETPKTFRRMIANLMRTESNDPPSHV